MLELSFLVGVGLIVVALLTFPYWWSTLVLVFTPMRPLKFEVVDSSVLPKDMFAAAQQAAATLVEQGFVFMGCIRNRSIMTNVDAFQHHFYYFHADDNIIASVTEMPFPGLIRDFEITLRTFFSDDTELWTVDCYEHQYLHLLEKIIVQDGYSGDFHKQLALHRERTQSLFAKKTIKPCVNNIAEFVVQENTLAEQLLNYWLSHKYLFKGPAGALINNPIAVFALIRRFISGQKRACSVIGQQREVDQLAPLSAYGIAKQLQFRRSRGRLSSLVIFVASLVVFMVSFGVVFDAVFAVLLALVVFIHELGHFLAMRMMGYKNSSMMFLPFIGGITLGEKDDAKPWQQVVMYLAGPVPGLVVGGGIFLLGGAEYNAWMHQFALLLIIINLMNLLPITPLDGGRVLDVLLLAKRPWWGYAFKVFGCAIILGAALWMTSYLMLIIALPLAWSVYTQWGILRHLKTIPAPPADIQHERTQCVDYVAQQVAKNEIAPTKKLLLAQALLQYFQANNPTAKEMLAGLASYCLVLGFGVYVACSYFNVWRDDFGENYETKEYWLEALEYAEQDEQWPLLTNAASSMMAAGNIEDAEFFIQKIQHEVAAYTEPNWHLAQWRILNTELRDLMASNNTEGDNYEVPPLSAEDYSYVRDNILGDETSAANEVLTQFYALMRRTPDVSPEIKLEWIHHFEKRVTQLSPQQAAYLYLEKGKIYYEQDQTGLAISAFMLGFDYEQKNEFNLYSHSCFDQLVNIFVEQEDFSELLSIAQQRWFSVEASYQNRLKEYDDIDISAYFLGSYLSEQRSLKQLQSWAMFWNKNTDAALVLNQEAIAIDTRRRAEGEDADWDNRGVALHVEKELFSGFLTFTQSRLKQRDPFDDIPNDAVKKFKKSCDCKKRGAYDAARNAFYAKYVE